MVDPGSPISGASQRRRTREGRYLTSASRGVFWRNMRVAEALALCHDAGIVHGGVSLHSISTRSMKSALSGGAKPGDVVARQLRARTRMRWPRRSVISGVPYPRSWGTGCSPENGDWRFQSAGPSDRPTRRTLAQKVAGDSLEAEVVTSNLGELSDVSGWLPGVPHRGSLRIWLSRPNFGASCCRRCATQAAPTWWSFRPIVQLRA